MRGLHVEEGRRDHKKLRRARQVGGSLREGDELVCNLRERDLSDVELVARDQ